MKKSKIWLLLFLIIPCAFIFSACSLDLLKDNKNNDDTNSNTTYVVNIEKSTSTDSTDTYLVTYSDMSTTLITIENGEDGKDGKDGLDGKDITLDVLKEYCKEENISLEQFIEDHMVVEYQQPAHSINTATTKALKSTVSVWCQFPTTSKDVLSGGAGVIYEMNETYTYIITNYHVVYYANSTTANKVSDNIHVFTYGSQEMVAAEKDLFGNIKEVVYGYGAIECKYVGGAMNYDIAILRANTEDIKKFQPAACAIEVASNYEVGEDAIAIGNPESEGTSVTTGIVSKYSEDLTMTGADDVTEVTFRVMRIDTAVNSGNSGGGLFNIEGKLIGIVNAKISSTDVENIAYALPFDNVTKVANNIIAYHKATNDIASVKKLLLNIQYTTENHRSEFVETTTGTTINLYTDCVVATITDGGLGHKMGLQAKDIITSAIIIRNGQEIKYNFKQAYEIAELMLDVRAGDELILKVKRGEVTLSTTSQTITADMLITVQ